MSENPSHTSQFQPMLLWYERLLLGVLAVMLLTLLATAAWLSPRVQGLGTHQQLGLPPCTFATHFGMRCPSCGMTTSWAHLMNGNVLGSMQANSAGCLLGVLAVITGPWALISAIRGRWAAGPPRDRTLIFGTVVVVVVVIADWFYRIF